MVSNRLLTVVASAMFCAVLPDGVHAEVDEVVRNARAFLEHGQARHAFDLLEPLEAPRAGDPDFDITLGIAANETGQFTRAVFALERALTVAPANTRARAELGRALFALGDNAAARRVLQEARKEAIPTEAAKTIDDFLQAIERNEEAARSSVKVYVEAGYGYDSNVNSGPADANVAVPAFGGAIFTLTPGGVKTADSFYSLGAGVSGRYVIDPRWSLIANASGTDRIHHDQDTFDTRQLDLNAGFSYRYEKHEFALAAQVGSYAVDNTTFRQQHGLVGEWTYRLDGYRQWSTYLQTGRLTYPTQRIRDADRHVLGTSYAQVFSSGLLVFGGGYVGVENERASGVAQLGHKLVGLRGGVQKPLSAEVATFANLSYEHRRFGGTDPLFLIRRTDRQLNLNLGLTWVPARLWRVTPQLSYTSTDSNIAISKFDKQVLSVTVRRDF